MDERDRIANEAYEQGRKSMEPQIGFIVRTFCEQIDQLKAQITALQAHNTELLLRARRAEENRFKGWPQE